jgi:hypothetical protein
MKLRPPFPRHPGPIRPLRIVAILLATLLLHLIFADWGRKQLGVPQPSEPATPVVAVTLQPAPVVPAAPPQPKPKPRPKPPAPAPQRRPAPAPAPQPAQQEAPTVIAGNQGDWQLAPAATGTATGGGSGAGTADAAPAAPPPPPAPAPAHRPDPPQSAELNYNVEGLRNNQKVYGSGSIVWHNDGGRYRVDGRANVLFFTLLEFSSEGTLDDFGVAPALYTEKRFRKTATLTHFAHDSNTITFSASDNRYSRPGDAQDRASIIWQLAAIGRGNPDAFVAGATFELFVAGVRDAEPWQISVVGKDSIDIGGAPAPVWHLMRLPRPGSYDQKIDIWLAPQREWYPAKIRYTETNGEYLDMSLSSIRQPDPS